MMLSSYSHLVVNDHRLKALFPDLVPVLFSDGADGIFQSNPQRTVMDRKLKELLLIEFIPFDVSPDPVLMFFKH